MQWYNEPAQWTALGDQLTVMAEPQTDFWRKTRHAFIKDDGHFYFQEVDGDFLCTVVVRGAYANLYDQAGLMVRVDASTWLKCGIEFVDGVQYASAVVTRDYSDWSVAPLPGQPNALWLRVSRIGSAVEVAYSLDGTGYTLLRQAYLSDQPMFQVGPMCAAPTGEGLSVTFEGFSVEAAPEDT